MPNRCTIGEFHIDPSLHTVRGPAGTVRLEPKVMQVLVCLAEHRHEVVSKERLIRAVWPDTFVSDDVLTRAISELRRVFGDRVKDPRFIETIPKSGYRLIAAVQFASAGGNRAQDAIGAEAPRVSGEDHAADAAVIRARAPGARRRSGRTVVAAVAIVAAVLVVAVIAQRSTGPPSGRIVRSVQLTLDGNVVSPGFGEDAYFPSLATDGGRIYFTRSVGVRQTLAQAPIGGGEVVPIPLPVDHAHLLSLSPDASRLLVREFNFGQVESPLWIIPVVGGAPLRLGAIVAHDGSWSPDGKRLILARGEELYLADSDGRNPRKFASTPGRAFWLRWSPDGTRLRFSVFNPEGSAPMLWEISADGQALGPVPLSREDHDNDCCGEWSPDGRHFFFRRFREDRADIWVVPAGNGWFGRSAAEPVRLTSGPLQFSAAVPVRDGRLLAVAGQQRGENLRFDPRARTFAPYPVAGWGGWFTFSRDGEWVAYVQYRLTDMTLWRSRVDGTDRLQLTQAPLRLLLPRWSPDGSRIAFMGRMPGQHWQIYAIGAEGGEPQPIVMSGRPESDPDWAPHGASLMFGRPPDYLAEPSTPKAIHLLDLRTRELSTLPESEGLFASRWSPSGRYVAALTLDHASLRLFDWSTRTWTELGRFKTLHNPVWSRDEQYLYFEIVDEVGVYRLRISDRTLEKVASLKPSQSGFCVFEGLTPDDAPLISCHRYDPDIYALEWEMR